MTITYISLCIKPIQRSWLALLMAIALPVCLTSCFEHNNRGLPSAVYFSAEGGSKIINGTTPMTHFEIIHDKSGEVLAYSQMNDIDTETDTYSSLSASYGWIEVRQEYRSTQLEITVLPLEDNKDRKVVIEGYYGPEYAKITVIQKGEK